MSIPYCQSHLEIENHGEVTIVKFLDHNILDPKQIDEIKEKLYALIDEKKRNKLILDLKQVSYLSSNAMAKFITLNKKVAVAAGKLVMCNICPSILRSLKETKFDRIFRIENDEQAALKAFSN